MDRYTNTILYHVWLSLVACLVDPHLAYICPPLICLSCIVGTERGFLYATIVPMLERFCSFRAHQQRVLDVIPLPPSIGEGVLSLSSQAVQFHASGGCPRFVHEQDKVGSFLL